MPESPETVLVVIRHGQTMWNAQGRQQGHLDSDLTPLGRRQAEAIADRFAGQTFDALYSSDLGRALRTAEYVAKKTHLKIITDQRLRERNLGIFQGLTMAEVKEKYPDEHARYVQRNPDYVIPDGESIRQRNERITRCADEIAARHPGGQVLVVAHGGVASSLFRHALAIPLTEPRRYKLFNASINTFFVKNGNWHLGAWGDISHLATIGTDDDW